jgi:hypothetical protein
MLIMQKITPLWLYNIAPCFIVVVRIEMSSLRENHHLKSCHQKDLLRQQTLRVLFRGLYAQMGSALAKTTEISLSAL